MADLDSNTRRLVSDPVKRQAWIKYQIQMQGRSMAQVAEDAGVHRCSLYSAFYKPYPRMEKVIADAVGVPVTQLWPERYDADGLPNRRMGRPQKSGIKRAKSNTGQKARNVRRGKAA